MEATVVTAPGDGAAPAVLLSLGGRPGQRGLPGQYLFGSPEGFSRLAREHGVRPGLHLRALFAADACGALAGAGSLLMRLRGEGHGQLHVVGPQGAADGWVIEWLLTCLPACLDCWGGEVRGLELAPVVWGPPVPAVAQVEEAPPCPVVAAVFLAGLAVRPAWHLQARRPWS